jgi:hypothetical protein
MHHSLSRLHQFWGKLGNSTPTCFQPKQAARSRCVSCVILLPSVLWCNRKTVARLVLRLKPMNRHGDFEDQITKPELPVLRHKPRNPSHRFWGQIERNRRPWFWGSIKMKRLVRWLKTAGLSITNNHKNSILKYEDLCNQLMHAASVY